jgi:hypothetical protein
MDIFKGIDGKTEFKTTLSDLNISLSERQVPLLIAEKLADAFMEKFGAEVLAKIDIQTVANLAALKIGGKAEQAVKEYTRP